MPETRIAPREIPWWQNAQNVAQIEAIKQSQSVERDRLAFQKQKFSEILELWKGAFGEGGTGGTSVPSEFAENIGLFQPGGQFGEGSKAEVELGGQKAIAAGQIGLARTGMSSGTNVAGLHARVAADTALARKKIEGQRVSLLGDAFTQAGAAKLTTQQIQAQREANLMRSLAMFG
ncbi:MAG: hypothetical protein ACYS8Z_15700 [Planctomycetota bacterium]|jgi:hypothetical protein